jgi:hypothetical protein
MGETVGLRSYAVIFHPQLIKRDALMFRRIGINGCDKLREFESELSEAQLEVLWLMEQGIVFNPRYYFDNALASADEATRKSLNNLFDYLSKYGDECDEFFYNEERLVGYFNQIEQEWDMTRKTEDAVSFKDVLYTLFTGEFQLRLMSAYYRNTKHIDAYPLISGRLPELSQETGSTGDVIEIAINHLPAPDDSTSWEQILDFRNDPDTERKFLDLRNWMNDTARAKLTPIEVEQKLEWLLQEYRQHMELHRMKINASTLETVIVTGAEIAENLIKLQFGKLAKGLFSLRHRRLALLEGELKSPGREIAFISKAQETFHQ